MFEFVWLPTEYGKSLYYQLTPFMVDCKLEKCGEEDCGYVVIVALQRWQICCGRTSVLEIEIPQKAATSAAVLLGTQSL